MQGSAVQYSAVCKCSPEARGRAGPGREGRSCGAVQCSVVQCSAVQGSAGQCAHVSMRPVVGLDPEGREELRCSAVQCSAVQRSAVQCAPVALRPAVGLDPGGKGGVAVINPYQAHSANGLFGQQCLWKPFG
jgi:hypothetical protein